MDNIKIANLLGRNLKTTPYFGGVYSRDSLPTMNLRGDTKKFIVANMSKHNERGTHWIAIMMCGNHEKNEYFDSYGWPVIHSEFNDYVGEDVLYNKTQLQHDTTTTCGQWCIFYIWRRCMGQSMKEITNMFNDKHPLVNDFSVTNAVEKEFETQLSVSDKTFLRDALQQTCTNKRQTEKYCCETI